MSVYSCLVIMHTCQGQGLHLLDNSSEGYSTLESGCSPDNPPFEVALLSDLKSSAHFIYLFILMIGKVKTSCFFFRLKNAIEVGKWQIGEQLRKIQPLFGEKNQKKKPLQSLLGELLPGVVELCAPQQDLVKNKSTGVDLYLVVSIHAIQRWRSVQGVKPRLSDGKVMVCVHVYLSLCSHLGLSFCVLCCC